MVICLRVLKESSKSIFDSYSVRNSVLLISHITFRDCRVHIFSDNLSRNSCILFALNGKHWNSGPFSSQFITHRFKANECQLKLYFQHVSPVLFPGLNNLRCNILGLKIANCLASVLKHSPPRSLTQSSRGKNNSSWVSMYDQNDPTTVSELQITIFLERTYFQLSRRFGRTKQKWGQTQSRAH